MFRVVMIAGTRPEIIKLEPVVKALASQPSVEITMVHSGQHESHDMFGAFLEELGMTDVRLISAESVFIKSLTLSALEKIIEVTQPHIILAQGDTFTVATAAMMSNQARIPFGHIEAGLRSFDLTMPEESNRIVADHLARVCFAPTSISASNLAVEGILPDRIEVTGNTIVDSCMRYRSKAEESRIIEQLKLVSKHPLVLLTLHRIQNVDDPRRLCSIVENILALENYHFVFPIHPRTRDRLISSKLDWRLSEAPNVTMCSPLGYLDFLKLLCHSDVIVTDSGGVQEESAVLGKRCLVLREATERPETVISGNCRLIDVADFEKALKKDLSMSNWPIPARYQGILGDGNAGGRIAKSLLTRLKRGFKMRSPNYLTDGFATLQLLDIGDKIVSESRNPLRIGKSLVLSVYDECGRPCWPGQVKTLRKGMSALVLGKPSAIDRLESKR